MKVLKFSSAVIALGLLMSVAGASSNDEQQIRALYAKLGRGLQTKDVALVESLEAPGFTGTSQGRTMNQKQFGEMMRSQFKMTKSIKKFSFKITGIKVSGKKAHATTSFTSSMTIAGQGKPPKDHVIDVSGTTAEELVKTSKGWLFLSEKNTGSTAKMDGKPMNTGGG